MTLTASGCRIGIGWKMKTTWIGLFGVLVLALTIGGGCSPKRKLVSERDRKEAVLLVSEAQFAMTLRDWPRAEGLLVKAVEVAPEAEYWMNLGTTRVRLNNRAGAKKAYEAALKLFQDEAARDNTRADPWLHQANVLALLGRPDDSRAVLAKAAKQFPKDNRVQIMLDPKRFQEMITAPGFKENAL
jgi:tetratricopeptide (TPR) repeat protein